MVPRGDNPETVNISIPIVTKPGHFVAHYKLSLTYLLPKDSEAREMSLEWETEVQGFKSLP
jgi:hypothetical protein